MTNERKRVVFTLGLAFLGGIQKKNCKMHCIIYLSVCLVFSAICLHERHQSGPYICISVSFQLSPRIERNRRLPFILQKGLPSVRNLLSCVTISSPPPAVGSLGPTLHTRRFASPYRSSTPFGFLGRNLKRSCGVSPAKPGSPTTPLTCGGSLNPRRQVVKGNALTTPSLAPAGRVERVNLGGWKCRVVSTSVLGLKIPQSWISEASHSAAARAEQFFSRKICVLSEVQDERACCRQSEVLSKRYGRESSAGSV